MTVTKRREREREIEKEIKGKRRGNPPLQMEQDILIQAAFLLLTLAIFVTVYNLPKKALTKLRSSNRSNIQSNRHFLHGAQLLSRARSTRNRTAAVSHAKDALSHADAALALRPRDPAAHILRALALDLLGRKSAALRSLDAALSPPASKSLSDVEKGDALVKRAELHLAVNRKRRVDSAVEDLLEATALTKDNDKAYCILGQCYEYKGMRDDALNSYHQALKLASATPTASRSSSSALAREGLARLSYS